MSKFIMLVGLPGSGKSTYANKLTNVEKVTKYLSSDKIREELYGDEAIQGDPNKVFGVMRRRAKQYLEEGYDVVYDATNVTRKNRRGILSEVKPICEDDGLECHIVWAPYQECVNRDQQRKRSVGEAVIRKMLYRWQSPFFDEGFNKIEVIYNCNIEWDRIKYNNAMIENMNIPHDNPHHKLNILEHSEEAQTYIFNKYQDYLLEEAAAFHDIGKPFTKCYKSDEQGKLIPVAHYYQHDNVGGYFVYGCYAPGSSNAVIVSWLVCNHMQPYFNSNYYIEMKPYLKSMIDKLHEADVAAH